MAFDIAERMDDALDPYSARVANAFEMNVKVDRQELSESLSYRRTLSPMPSAEARGLDRKTVFRMELMGRFEGSRKNFRERRNGGVGAFTPDNVPIFDWIAPNVYMIADSNHGFKMTGVGKLVAKLLAGGDRVAELEPFALDRFANGRTFGSSNSHCPWV